MGADARRSTGGAAAGDRPPVTAAPACCIAGGGPAGMMLGLLLARAGVRVRVLEKHSDFLRDFRGDTIHPSTLQVLDDIGLIDAFLALPHRKVRRVRLPASRGSVDVDLARLGGRYPYIAFVPQWDFLDLVAAEGCRLPNFHLSMGSEVRDLLVEEGRVVGVRTRDDGGDEEVRALLTIGADGRDSVVRQRSGIEVAETSPPMDVFWFRVSRRPDDPDGLVARVGGGHMAVLIDRGAYWQIAYIIPKGAGDEVRQQGIESLRDTVGQLVPEFGERVQEIGGWDDVSLLTVRSNHVRRWWRPGLLLIGDAAHAMSPIGGVGINLAVQDAVAAHNILARPLLRGRVDDGLLARVERRRRLPAALTQRVQAMLQSTVVAPALGARPAEVPWPVRTLLRTPYVDRLLPRFVGQGFRPERVRPAP
ncbi:MAG TPA: FAD-dependent oxidoreductase [Candidatus Dormibacteraeota bacterium]|nr:FAD-dependent oxidoreductase [Candidatus Dormibacteraeota bacterium]